MAQEMPPELDEKVLAALRQRIAEQEAQKISAARGEATARGLTGSTFEATRVALANKYALQAQTDAEVNIAVQRANMAREDRHRQEDQTFQVSQREAQERYNALENEKQRAVATGETEKVRKFEEQQNLIRQDYESAENERKGKTDLIGAGIQGGAYLLGNGLFPGGGGAPVAGQVAGGLFSKAGMLTAGKSFMAPGSQAGAGSMLGSAAGIGAGVVGGAYAGQRLAKLTGKNTREAKAGSTIGAAAGTALFGPVGGIVGGAVGGLATKGIQGAYKSAKKVFCFDPRVVVAMKDGTKKQLLEVRLGDEVEAGGRVESVRIAFADPDDFYLYGNTTIVTGKHAVMEDNKWVRVEDSRLAEHVTAGDNKAPVVASLVTEAHRLIIDGHTFADELESDDYEDLTIGESLDSLNKHTMEAVYRG